MPIKGSNSILFDFYSIVDKEISVIKYIASEYKNLSLENFDTDRILHTTDNEWIMNRIYGVEGAFKSILIEDRLKAIYDDILNMLIERDEKEILNHAFPTSMKNLLAAYKKAAGGVIKTSIQCETEIQKDYITKYYPDIQIEYNHRKDIDMDKYGRLVVANYKDALEYTLEIPKSILILNFRENFMNNDITQLRPELVINLGDIHDIEVVSAYRAEFDIKG